MNTGGHLPVWLALGSAPSAPLFVDEALAIVDVRRALGGRVITANASWELVWTSPTGCDRRHLPDYYFVADPNAVKKYARVIRRFRELEIPIITLKGEMPESEIAERDLVIHNKPIGLSGLECIRFAMWPDGEPTQRPKVILCVGHDGYRSHGTNRVVDGWNGDLGPQWGPEYCQRIAQTLGALANASPDTHFVVCGEPLWRDQVKARPNLYFIQRPEFVAPLITTVIEKAAAPQPPEAMKGGIE